MMMMMKYINTIIDNYIVPHEEMLLKRLYSSIIGNAMRVMVQLPITVINDINIYIYIYYDSPTNGIFNLWIRENNKNNNILVILSMTPIAKDSSIIVIYCDAQEDIPNGFISLSETYYYDIYIYIICM